MARSIWSPYDNNIPYYEGSGYTEVFFSTSEETDRWVEKNKTPLTDYEVIEILVFDTLEEQEERERQLNGEIN